MIKKNTNGKDQPLSHPYLDNLAGNTWIEPSYDDGLAVLHLTDVPHARQIRTFGHSPAIRIQSSDLLPDIMKI